MLQEFSKHTNAVFFPVREKTIQLHFDKQFIAPFKSWEDAFSYIGHKVQDRTALIIDEFPYIIEENPSVKSLLQHAIDHSWKNKNIFLILCGPSVSVMKNEIMGRKSPLHDRQTATLEITPFDYLESSNFFPNYSNENKLIAYGILGGIPRYLEAFNANKSILENVASKIIRNKSDKKAIFMECKFTSSPCLMKNISTYRLIILSTQNLGNNASTSCISLHFVL
ncbi:AAA family ATPase [Amedibacillus dolichus]|uniref:AAA family ATPase n=1 Tax=Amedibacillus dolichus TaxID=31971 RepID=UPI0021751DAC